MARHVSMRFGAVGGTQAGLGQAAGGTLVADRPEGRAGGQGLGFNGAELLAAALGGCFWNDLHYAAEAAGESVQVEAVEAEVELAGNPLRVVRARVAARLAGAAADRIFAEASASSTIAHSIMPAIPVQFERR